MLLRHVAETHPDPTLGRHPHDIAITQRNGTTAGFEFTDNGPQQGRFAGPVATEHRHRTASVCCKSHIEQNLPTAV
jgi:hypothetical protein